VTLEGHDIENAKAMHDLAGKIDLAKRVCDEHIAEISRPDTNPTPAAAAGH
jgi:hypothetical protein